MHRRAPRQESSTKEAPEIIRRHKSEAKPLGSRIRARFAEIGLDEDVPELRGEAARPATSDK